MKISYSSQDCIANVGLMSVKFLKFKTPSEPSNYCTMYIQYPLEEVYKYFVAFYDNDIVYGTQTITNQQQ